MFGCKEKREKKVRNRVDLMCCLLLHIRDRERREIEKEDVLIIFKSTIISLNQKLYQI
jgi:hypothetical protein